MHGARTCAYCDSYCHTDTRTYPSSHAYTGRNIDPRSNFQASGSVQTYTHADCRTDPDADRAGSISYSTAHAHFDPTVFRRRAPPG